MYRQIQFRLVDARPPLDAGGAFNTLQYGNSPSKQGRVTIALGQGYHIETHLVVTLLGTSPFRIPANAFQYGVCGGDSHPTLSFTVEKSYAIAYFFSSTFPSTRENEGRFNKNVRPKISPRLTFLPSCFTI